MASRLLVVLLALAPAAQAETYKWIDERGVVNYSNTPPPAAAKAPQQIADRVSTYQTDPALRAVAARGVTPYETMLHQEWMQRQRLMSDAALVKAAYAQPVVDDAVYYPRTYGYSYGYGGRRSHSRHRHHSGRGFTARSLR
jgi:hypothetical protein